MNKTETFEIEPSEETWAMRRGGRGLVAPARKTSCRCGRCRLYRWYPPLLVVSTIMTAVFCFLYLTKPVFLQAPVMKVHDGGNKVPPGYMIADVGGETMPPASAAAIPRELDPGRLSFPEESNEVDPLVAALSQPDSIDLLDVPPSVEPVTDSPVVGPPMSEPMPEPMPVRVSVGKRSWPSEAALPGGFEPLRVEKADRPLFQSLTKADFTLLEAPKKANVAPSLAASVKSVKPDAMVSDDSLPSSALEIEGIEETADEADADVALVEETSGEGGEKPMMKASFIGEFYQNAEESEKQEVLNETVMR